MIRNNHKMQQFAVKSLTSLLFSLASASNVMEGAIVSTATVSTYSNSLIDTGFNNLNSFYGGTSGVPGLPDGTAEFTVILAEPIQNATIFINNSCFYENTSKKFGESILLAGNDSSAWS